MVQGKESHFFRFSPPAPGSINYAHSPRVLRPLVADSFRCDKSLLKVKFCLLVTVPPLHGLLLGPGRNTVVWLCAQAKRQQDDGAHECGVPWSLPRLPLPGLPRCGRTLSEKQTVRLLLGTLGPEPALGGRRPVAPLSLLRRGPPRPRE